MKWFLFLGVGCLVLLGLVYLTLIPVSSLRHFNPKKTALMLEQPGPEEHRWVPLSQISPALRRAVIIAEDGNFYNHHGVDFYEMKESIRKNLKKKKFSRGFSTITMQVAKNLYLFSEKSILRKALEIIIALRMEQVLSKERILEIYLNVAEWGKGIYGAEGAARHYFGKSASTLNDTEASFLAAILPNPKKWGRQPPGAYVQRRMEGVLMRMGVSVVPSEPVPKIPDLPEEETPETRPETEPETQEGL